MYKSYTITFRVESNLVIVEGTPYKHTNNQTMVTVHRIEDINPKHVACAKFLAYSGPATVSCTCQTFQFSIF